MADRRSEELRTFAHLSRVFAAGFPADVMTRRVRVVVGEDVLEREAGQVLVLTVGRLMPRLWHNLDFVCPTRPAARRLQPLLAGSTFSGKALAQLATLIWEDGEFTADDRRRVDLTMGVGTDGDISAGIDATGAARVSQLATQHVNGCDTIPAALSAAAIASSEAVKLICPELGFPAVDDLRFATGPFGGPLDGGMPTLERPVLAGVGAVGCAFLYALICLGAKGSVVLLDPDAVNDSNLMRYILFDRRHIGRLKVDAAADLIDASGVDLAVEKAPVVFQEHLRCHPAERDRCKLVISAVDTYEARRQIASELPRQILNAGTTARDFTVSRHGFADGHACLACLYPARPEDAAEDAVQSRELGLPQAEIVELRRTRSGLTPQQLRRIAETRREPPDKYIGSVGEPLQSFYNKEFCGKTHVATSRGEAVAPLAFSSAWAGFSLAQALAAEPSQNRYFRIDTMTGMAHPICGTKGQRDRCPVCGQRAYRKTYTARWSDAS